MTHEFQRDSDAVENKKSHTDYTYDALNRLTGSTRKLEIYPYNTLSYTYTYDTLGNLLQEAGPTTKDLDTYQYNDLNQMTAREYAAMSRRSPVSIITAIPTTSAVIW